MLHLLYSMASNLQVFVILGLIERGVVWCLSVCGSELPYMDPLSRQQSAFARLVHAPRAPAAVSPQQPATCCGTCHISSQMGDQSHTSAVQVTGRSCSRRCRSSIARRLASCQIVLKQPHRVKQHSMPCSHVPAGDASSHPEACERIFALTATASRSTCVLPAPALYCSARQDIGESGGTLPRK